MTLGTNRRDVTPGASAHTEQVLVGKQRRTTSSGNSCWGQPHKHPSPPRGWGQAWGWGLNPQAGGELSSAPPGRQARAAEQARFFNLGIRDGNLKGILRGPKGSKQEHRETAAHVRKSIRPESFMRPWIF